MKRILQFLILAVLVLTASIVLADSAAAPAALTLSQMLAQVLAQLPPWLQWVIVVFAILSGPTGAALWKSERLALNEGTAVNGLWHGIKLARAALSTLPKFPDVPDAPEEEPEPVIDSKAAQISALKAQLAELEGGANA